MTTNILVVITKIFSLALVLNSLVTLACIAQIMFNYWHSFPYWQPYAPYLINGSVIFLVVVAAIVNIFPSANIGRGLHIRRFLFHHYFYGFITILFGAILIVVFTSVSLVNFFLIWSSNLTVNAGRFFVLAGLALFLDDLPDVSNRVKSALVRLKFKAYEGRKLIHLLQLIAGLSSTYAFIAVSLWATKNLSWAFPASFMIGTFLVTSLTSLVFVKRKAWLKVTV